MVPVTGVEPVRYRYHWILSPARLPIPSHRHTLGTSFYLLTGRLKYYTPSCLNCQVLFSLTFSFHGKTLFPVMTDALK